jgi:hypothetical protein
VYIDVILGGEPSFPGHQDQLGIVQFPDDNVTALDVNDLRLLARVRWIGHAGTIRHGSYTTRIMLYLRAAVLAASSR